MTAFNRCDVSFHLGMQRNFRDVLVRHGVELPDALPGEQEDRSVEEAMKKIIAIIRRAGSSERDSVV